MRGESFFKDEGKEHRRKGSRKEEGKGGKARYGKGKEETEGQAVKEAGCMRWLVGVWKDRVREKRMTVKYGGSVDGLQRMER